MWNPNVAVACNAKNPFSCPEVIGRGLSNIGLTLENILQINDWKIFGLSRQPHYSSGSGGKQTRGFSEQKVALVSKRKSTDWPSTVIIPGVPQVLLGWELVWGHLQSWFSWESEPWGLHLRGQSLLLYGPLQTEHGARGSLEAWGQSPSRYPLSTVITSPALFSWVPLGIFLRLFQSRSNSLCWGFSLLPGSFLPLIFFLVFSTIIYSLSQL